MGGWVIFLQQRLLNELQAIFFTIAFFFEEVCFGNSLLFWFVCFVCLLKISKVRWAQQIDKQQKHTNHVAWACNTKILLKLLQWFCIPGMCLFVRFCIESQCFVRKGATWFQAKGQVLFLKGCCIYMPISLCYKSWCVWSALGVKQIGHGAHVQNLILAICCFCVCVCLFFESLLACWFCNKNQIFNFKNEMNGPCASRENFLF